MPLRSGLVAAAVLMAGPAFAGIEVPSKAVWSVTDIDGMQFCAKCNPDDVASATRIKNYERTIADTVAMGARHILVHARTGSGRAARVAEFATALATHNAAAPASDKACIAVMYADYGTGPKHTDSEITALFTSAWATTGANYCVIDGRPVISTLDDRTDQTCAPGKFSNIVTRLRTLATGVAPAAVHWVAAFGERSEYSDWTTACRGQITGPGIPITYSYLEMANDDPLFANDAAARRDAVKASGGRYILGLPSSSAQNCGDFCGDLADSESYRHTGFGGFSRLLAAWRVGTDNVAYTYGPGGLYGRDQFASSASRCDANDLATGTTACASITAADEPLIPGVPGDGTIIDEPDPPAGADCEVEPPAPAKALGLTKLDFCDGFDTNTLAVGNTAAERRIGNGKKWTSDGPTAFGYTRNPPSDFSHNAEDGTVTLDFSVNMYQRAMQAHQVQDGKLAGYTYHKPRGWYLEFRMMPLEFGSPSNIAVWSFDTCHWDNLPAPCPTTGKFLEMDFSEFPSGAMNPRSQNRTIGKPEWPHDCSLDNGTTRTALNVWKTHGVRGEPASGPAGRATMRRYGNNVEAGFRNSSNCGGYADNVLWFNDVVSRRHIITIGGKVGDKVKFDFVRMWTHPDDG